MYKKKKYLYVEGDDPFDTTQQQVLIRSLCNV